MKVWKVELNDLLEKIERHTSASLWRIKREFERSGLTFDRKFRKRFLRLASNRLSETYDRIEIESLAMNQRSRGHHHLYNHHYDSGERNVRYSGRRVSEDRDPYPKKNIAWHENAERSLYSDRAKYSTNQRLGNIHKRLGKKVLPSGSQTDMDAQPSGSGLFAPHESYGMNPFRSSGRPFRSIATMAVPESSASQSADDTEPYPMIKVKLEIPTSPMASPKCDDRLKRKREGYDMENGEIDSDDNDITEVAPKRQKTDSDTIDLETELDASGLDDMIFYCVHCTDANELNDSNSGTIEEVYGHWLSGHTDLNGVKPFWFYVTQHVACFYCDAVLNYHEMVKHHKVAHADDTFAVVQQTNHQKCALCRYIGDEMVEHFAVEHDGLLKSQLFNPARMPERLLADLFAVDIHKKRQCGQCDAIFETQHEVQDHLENIHDEIDQSMDFKEFFDSKSAYVICDYCSSKVDGTTFFNHIEKHRYDFKCTKCDFSTDILLELVVHEKNEHRNIALNFYALEYRDRLKKHFFNSKVVFGNGLVLTNHNFKSTLYDDSRQFDAFIERLVDIMRRKFKRMTKRDEANGSENEDDVGYAAGSSGMSRAQSVASNGSDATTKRNYSIDSQRNPFRVCTLNEPAQPQLTELEKQNQLNNNLSIVGLPRLDDDNVMEMFLKFCEKIKVKVLASDVVEIYRNGGVNEPVIVQFQDFDTKNMVRNYAHMRQVWTNDLVELPEGEQPTKIFVNLHTTRYYGKMISIAREARKSNSLFSYYLCKRGLAVRRTENSKERIVLSTSELIDYIYRHKHDNDLVAVKDERADRTSK